MIFVLLVGVGWIVVTGLMARHQADQMRRELGQLRSALLHGDSARASDLEASMRQQASRARSLTAGPAWWTATKIPYLGDAATTARGATAVVDELANDVLPKAVSARSFLKPADLRLSSDQVDVARIQQAALPLTAASTQSDALLARANALPGHTWLGIVNSSRSDLISSATSVVDQIHQLAAVTAWLPNALGADRPRHYLVVFQTDSESRGLGGLPGSWALLAARNGKLKFTRFGADTDIRRITVHPGLTKHYRHEYKLLFHHHYRPYRSWANSDPSPHFPVAAKIWMAMWQKRYGIHLNGALTTDPVALRFMLPTTGKITLSDGMVINARNVAPFFEHQIYLKFASAGTAVRKQYQQDAAKAVAERILSSGAKSLPGLTRGVRQAINNRRLMIFTRNRAIERVLLSHRVGGALPKVTNPFVAVTMNMVRAGKMGYYLRRSITYDRPSCGATTSTVTMKIHNTAPSEGLNQRIAGSYAYGPLSGSTIVVPALYATYGSTPVSVSYDGKHRVFRYKHERHHPVMMGPRLFLHPGQTRTVVFTVKEPPATGRFMTIRQPGVGPLKQTVNMPNCGG
ncbi:MAG: DUF4012 domain-containing protein [Frankiaceae bacterium]|nr:DUF4012 domain-containing protein [Frankiaceae bacterium]MBV9871533.1 DUF4012 domain-containing protein [Frankiaceae bacterium]